MLLLLSVLVAGQTPLIRAVSANQQLAVQLLLELGCDPSRCDNDDNNLLMIAALAQSRDMLLYLLRIREAKLKIALDDKNKEDKQLADMVGGADILKRLLNVASQQTTTTQQAKQRSLSKDGENEEDEDEDEDDDE